jgi:Domain of unknown function (DUF5753)
VLNEAVIRRVVGGADTTREQLYHIAKVAELPHVNVQVLPFGAGVHPAMVLEAFQREDEANQLMEQLRARWTAAGNG